MTEFPATFIIHLERDKARKPNVDLLLSKLPINAKVVAAVDGAMMNKRELRSHIGKYHLPPYPFRLRLAEIATFLSHRECWKEIIAQNLPYALILEDDLELGSKFQEAVALATSQANQGVFIRFPVKDREEPLEILTSTAQMKIFEPQVIGLGMQAQLVTKGAAENLLQLTDKFDRPVDTYLQMKWVHKIRILTLLDSGISEKSKLLGGSNISKRKGWFGTIWREMCRPQYRKLISYMSRR